MAEYVPLSTKIAQAKKAATTPAQPAKKASLWGSIMNSSAGKTFSGAINALDTVQRKAKQAALTGITVPSALIATGVARTNPTKFAGKTSLSGNIKKGLETAKSVGQVDFSGEFERSGLIKPATNWKGTVRNIVIDTVLDPTNLVTFGAGSGAKIVSKSGKAITLTREGQRAVEEITSKISKGAAKGTASDVIRAEAKSILASRIESGAKSAQKFVDKGGVKFAGKTVVPAKYSTDLIAKPLEATGKKLGVQKVFGGREALIKGNAGLTREAKKMFTKPEGQVERFIEASDNIFRNVPKNETDNMYRNIISGDVSSLSKEGQKAARFIQTTLDSYVPKLKAAGLLDSTRENYLPLIFKGNTAAREAAAATMNTYRNTVGATFKFSKHRVIDDIIEAQKLYQQGIIKAAPETDVRKLVQTYVESANKAIAKKQFLDEVAKTGVRTNVKLPDETEVVNPELMTRASQIGEPLVPIEDVKELKGLMVPQSTADYLRQISNTQLSEKSIKPILENYDKALSVFKSAVTTAFPSFNVRNFYSNVFQNYLDLGIIQALNPAKHAAVVKIMRASGKGLDDVISVGGQKMTVREMRKLMQDEGIIQRTSTFLDINKPYAATKGSVGMRVGRSIENEARGLNFLVNLEKTGDVATAAERTKQFLFDYNDITPFEKNYLKRLAFFYTWPSKNLKLQIEQLAKNPGKFTKLGIIQSELDKRRSSSDNALVGDSTKQDINIPLGTDNGVIKSIAGIDTPFSAMTDILANPIKYVANSLNPMVKVPIEIASGKQFYSGKKISELNSGTNASIFKYAPDSVKKAFGFSSREVTNDSGEKVTRYYINPYVSYILGALPTSRLTSEASKLSDTNNSAGERLLRFGTGVRIDKTSVKSQINSNASDFGDSLAKDFVNKGLLIKGNYGYYVPDNVSMSAEEKSSAQTTAKILNDRDKVKSLYLQSIGASPADFSGVVDVELKAIPKKTMAAILAYNDFGSEAAARILTPKAFKSKSSGRRVRVNIPSSKGKKASKLSVKTAAPNLSTSSSSSTLKQVNLKTSKKPARLRLKTK